MPLPSVANFPKFELGKGLADGDALQNLIAELFSAENGITATAGGTKGAARVIKNAKNTVSVCATGADSVLLPPGVAGREIWITNRGAASMQVFGAGSDTINGIATATGIAQGIGVEAVYYCDGVTAAGVGTWQQIISA